MTKTSKHTEAEAGGIYSNREQTQAEVVKCILRGRQRPGLPDGGEIQAQVGGGVPGRGDTSRGLGPAHIQPGTRLQGSRVAKSLP